MDINAAYRQHCACLSRPHHLPPPFFDRLLQWRVTGLPWFTYWRRVRAAFGLLFLCLFVTLPNVALGAAAAGGEHDRQTATNAGRE